MHHFCKRKLKFQCFVLLLILGSSCYFFLNWIADVMMVYLTGFTECSCVTNNDPLPDTTQIVLRNVDPYTNVSTYQSFANHPNFPIELWVNATDRCSLFPYITDIAWAGETWQQFSPSDGVKYLLYSAIYDDRSVTGAVIHILALIEGAWFPSSVYCHVWHDALAPAIAVKVANNYHIDYQWRSRSRLMPFLVTCPLTSLFNIKKPVAVALSSSPCYETTNVLKVVGSNTLKKQSRDYTLNQGRSELPEANKITIGVCGPALYYYNDDFSLRLIEWLELLKLMDVEKVYLYNTGVHPNVSKVLNYYQHQGFVHTLDFDYPPPYINMPSLRRLWTLIERHKMFAMENIYFTDCVLRNMHRHSFIAHFDPDEVPVISNFTTLTEMLQFLVKTNSNGPTPYGYKMYWNFFYNDLKPGPKSEHIPSHLHYLRHNRRVINRQSDELKDLGKTIYDTRQVVAVYSHNALLCVTGECSPSFHISEDVAYLGHFTKECKAKCTADDDIGEDSTLLKYEATINKSLTHIANLLDLLHI